MLQNNENGNINIQLRLSGDLLDNVKYLLNPEFMAVHKMKVQNINLDNDLFSVNIEFIPIKSVDCSGDINKYLDDYATTISNYIKNNYREIICDRLIKEYIDAELTDDVKCNLFKLIKDNLSKNDN